METKHLMTSGWLNVSSFWVRATFSHRWRSYLSIALLIGLIGGLSIGTICAAKRTQSSFDVFLASTNPSDLTVTLSAPNIAARLSDLPDVRHVAVSTYSVNAFPQGRNGAPNFAPALLSGDVISSGSVSDEYFSEDRVALVAGRMANPARANEFVIDATGERLMGWHIGQAIPMYFYTDAQASRPSFGTNKVKPQVALVMHLVGTIIPNDDVLLDQIDRKPDLMIFGPALTRRIVDDHVHYNDYALQLTNGTRDISKVEREIVNLVPEGTTYSFRVNSVIAAQINRSIEPETIALIAFGIISGLVALIIAASFISRSRREEYDDLQVVRALGASPLAMAATGSLGLIGAIITGAILAVVVAVGLSPLAPIGPVRAVYPDKGLAFQWTNLVGGFLGVVIVLLVFLGVDVVRRANRTVRQTTAVGTSFGSRTALVATMAGLPVTAIIGIRFALEPGRGRNSAPVRSAMLGTVIAVAIVVATLTFGSSLSTLVTHPPLYGWNWSYAITSEGVGVPPQAANLLNSDPYVQAWSGDSFANAQINGVTVPIILTTYHAKVTAPILSGHEVDAANQIVLGAATLAQLHKRVGDMVTVQYGSSRSAPAYVPPTPVRIVGTATLPAIGGVFTLHTSMGVGAIIPASIEPPSFRKFLHSPYEALNGHGVLLVRLRPGVPKALALKSLQAIAKVGTADLDATPSGGGNSIGVLSVQYPAEIENYRTIGVIPSLLALSLAVGAMMALGLTLVATVHRRRRDLAMLRALGFTSRQLLATIAWQASVAGTIGVLIGAPVGVIIGRELWTLFAHNIDAVPDPTVSLAAVIVVSLGAVVLANLVAALPGRIAARTSTARVLREE